VPTYAELLTRSDGPPGSCWGVFGPKDELGAVNFLTPERVLDGVGSVRQGRVFNLDYPINHFDPSPSGFRTAAKHTIFEYRPNHNDDYLDGLYLQGTSQIDGLRHVAHHVYGYYNFAAGERLIPGDPTLGVSRWADHGLVGRGVLLDVARHRRSLGQPLDHSESEPIGPELLEETAAAQGVDVKPGDLVLIRTDWPAHFAAHREHDFELARREAGLEQSHKLVAWLWDHQVPLVAADNFALEAYPDSADSPFAEVHNGEQIDGLIHPHLIAMLGLVVGELWNLDELADACSKDGVYEFLAVCKPLNLIGGVGSPANAMAIK